VNKIGKSVLLGLLSSGALFPLEAVLAQTATSSATNGDDSLETVIVTAQKREERLQDVPMSVTALSGNTLDKQQDHDFADYAALVPGLSLMSSGPGLTQLTLRGQNAGGDGSTVAVYLDESPIGSSNALLNGAVLSGDMDTWDLQRIEVLRGPQGTLYGANSEGGLLKFVTQAPILGSFSGAVEATGDVVDSGTGTSNGGDLRGVVNIPIGSIVALRVSAFDEALPGYIRDPLAGTKDVTAGHKDGGRASLLIEPSDTFSVRLTATEQEIATNGNNAVDVNPVTLQPVNGDLTQERYYGEPNFFKYENYNATINWNPGPVSIVSTTSYGVLDSDQVIDGTSDIFAPPTGTLGDLLTGAFGEPLGAYEYNNADLEKFTQEIRVASPKSNWLEWQVGGFYTHEQGSLDEHLNAFVIPGGANPGFPSLEIVGLDSTFQEWAGFGDVTFHFGPQFDLQLGGRYSANKQSAVEDISGLLVGGAVSYPGASKGNIWTYSVSPSFKIDTDTLLYARLATGYRPGGPNVLPAGAPAGVPLEYKSDSTTNVELGIRSTQANGRVTIDLAAFHVDWKDIQLLEEVDNYGVNGNGGSASSQGLEMELGLKPVNGLVIHWTGAYTNAVLTSPAPFVDGIPGDRLPFAPRWSTAVDAEYDHAAFADYQSFVGATWSYVGNRTSDFAASAAVAPIQVPLPSYNTLAARVGLENASYRVELFGKNLTNSRGITNYSVSGAPNLAGEINVIQPLTFGVTLYAKF